MEGKHKVQIFAMLCVTAICLMGLATGHDSTLIATSLTLIGYLAGVFTPTPEFRRKKEQREKEKHTSTTEIDLSPYLSSKEGAGG